MSSEDSTVGPGEGTGPTATVVLEGVPASALRFAQEQNDALLRELELIILGAGPGDQDAELPALRWDLLALREAFDTFRPMVTRQVDPGDASSAAYDLTLEVPVDTAERADRGNDLFDRLEARCGGLLLLAPPPALASGLRRWFFLQVAGQLRGEAAVSWPVWWAAHGDGSAPTPEAPQAPERG